MIVYEAIEIGSILELSIHLPDINCDIKVKAKGIWRSQFSVGTDERKCYDLGVEFVGIADEDRQKISKYVFKLS